MMPAALSIRPGTMTDIPFLAKINYEASLPPLNQCFWTEILAGTQTDVLQFIEAMLRARAANWGNVTDYLILEEQGKPVAAAAGYIPQAEDYCPLRLSGLATIAQDLHWSDEIIADFCDRYEQFWGSDCRPFFLTPQAPWIIENVAVLPESRGRGLGKVLLQALLEQGRSQHYSHAGIMVINGNDVARRTYESIGFQPYQTFHAEYLFKLSRSKYEGSKLVYCRTHRHDVSDSIYSQCRWLCRSSVVDDPISYPDRCQYPNALHDSGVGN
jgi:ribosomal protein S18 acetylase RimI-like enzyme